MRFSPLLGVSPYEAYQGWGSGPYNSQVIGLLSNTPKANPFADRKFTPMVLGDSPPWTPPTNTNTPDVPGWVAPVGTVVKGVNTAKNVGTVANSVRPGTSPIGTNIPGLLMGNANLGLLDAGAVGYNTLAGTGGWADLAAGPMQFGGGAGGAGAAGAGAAGGVTGAEFIAAAPWIAALGGFWLGADKLLSNGNDTRELKEKSDAMYSSIDKYIDQNNTNLPASDLIDRPWWDRSYNEEDFWVDPEIGFRGGGVSEGPGIPMGGQENFRGSTIGSTYLPYYGTSPYILESAFNAYGLSDGYQSHIDTSIWKPSADGSKWNLKSQNEIANIINPVTNKKAFTKEEARIIYDKITSNDYYQSYIG